MTISGLTRAKKAPLGDRGLSAIRSYLGGRRSIIIVAAAVIAAGLALNWSWLVAAGIAPLLLGLLPCVAMCALGMCMSRMTGRACPAEDASLKANELADGSPTVPAILKGND